MYCQWNTLVTGQKPLMSDFPLVTLLSWSNIIFMSQPQYFRGGFLTWHANSRAQSDKHDCSGMFTLKYCFHYTYSCPARCL